MKRVLVTGATGFVGRRLCRALLDQGVEVVAAVRRDATFELTAPGLQVAVVGDIGPETRWPPDLFSGVDAVLHLAARVHVFGDAADAEAEFHRVNVAGTARLAKAAAGRAGRFVFVSSLHAMRRLSDEILDEASACRPDTAYGRSKLQAEQELTATAARHGLETVVIRPCPVYGPGHVGRLGSLFNLVRQGWPLPLGGVQNRRSLIYVDNLVDALLAAAAHPAAAQQMFLVSDGEDVSITDLVCRIGQAAGRPPRLVPAPTNLLRAVGRLSGRSGAVERLLGSLAVDSTRIRTTLDWQPPHTLSAGLSETVRCKAA